MTTEEAIVQEIMRLISEGKVARIACVVGPRAVRVGKRVIITKYSSLDCTRYTTNYEGLALNLDNNISKQLYHRADDVLVVKEKEEHDKKLRDILHTLFME